jgi:hypothetical protein
VDCDFPSTHLTVLHVQFAPSNRFTIVNFFGESFQIVQDESGPAGCADPSAGIVGNASRKIVTVPFLQQFKFSLKKDIFGPMPFYFSFFKTQHNQSLLSRLYSAAMQ